MRLKDGSMGVVASREEVMTNKRFWNYSKLVYSMGKTSFFPFLNHYISKVFKPSSAYKVYSKAKVIYLIRFKAVGDAKRIAQRSPYWFDQHFLVVKRWDSHQLAERDL